MNPDAAPPFPGDPSDGAFGAAVPDRFEAAEASSSLHAAAHNLLTKVLRALRDGDEPRARRLVQRAQALPHDEHEEVRPVWWSAWMLLSDALMDELESSEGGDDTWLSAAEQVLADGPGAAAEVLRGALGVAADDYELPAAQAARARAAGGAGGVESWLARDPGDSEASTEAVLAVLRGGISYEAALARVRAARG